MSLTKYREKRHAERTPEPFGNTVAASRSAKGGVFVVQKHAARRLHYDFRLEMEGVLRSWAVPKGPSLNPADKHLAVAVEDHPLEYGDFEGVIPEGNYGAGAVIVWDRGAYTVLEGEGDAADAIRNGKVDIKLHGFKLNGAFTLVRTGGRRNADPKDKQNWLLIKKRDEYATSDDVVEKHPRSVLSGLTIDEIRDAASVGQKVVGRLEKLKAPEIAGPLKRANFPLTLAKLGGEVFDSGAWLFELKYDGVRALAIRDGKSAHLYARSGTDITARYPEVVLALNSLPYERFVIDGEIVAQDDEGRPSFQLLQRRMHVQDARQVARLSFAVPVRYYVFDLLAFDCFDTRNIPLEERKRLLSELILGEGPLRYCDHVIERGKDFYAAVRERRLEGIVGKLRDSPYRGTRSGDWLKIKVPQVDRFVIGGYTTPEGSRTHFGALLLGQYESDGSLRYTDKVGTGFNRDALRKIHAMLAEREVSTSPFRKSAPDEPTPERGAHFVRPELVCEVRFSEWTNSGGVRAPSFLGLKTDVDPRECVYKGPARDSDTSEPVIDDRADSGSVEEHAGDRGVAIRQAAVSDDDADSNENGRPSERVEKNRASTSVATVSNPNKIFFPKEGYTKGDVVAYYRAISKWMLPYLKDRPVMLTRYPDGIGGKSFYQKDAPGFAPSWIRREKIWSEDSKREIGFFIIDSEEALAYIANLGAITIHVWSSRINQLERPDWLLFDIDPKGSTTRCAVQVAHETAAVLRKVGLEPSLKTSGQMGLHVVVGLAPKYTYEQARMFSELVAEIVVRRLPKIATINRNPRTRNGRVYIDYLQLGHGKTIAAPFSVRPLDGAPVSAPMKWPELKPALDPSVYNIKTIVPRMTKFKRDPFLDAIEKPYDLESALAQLEELLNSDDNRAEARPTSGGARGLAG
jgi:bifunctional non-homologous end joining protein LigD